MNSKGGTLGIGISDNGDLLGIQPDLEHKNFDIDAYQNWLSTLLLNSIGKANVANYVSIRFDNKEDKVICLVDVIPSPKPVYANTYKGKEVFYARVENSTRIFEGAELTDYVSERF